MKVTGSGGAAGAGGTTATGSGGAAGAGGTTVTGTGGAAGAGGATGAGGAIVDQGGVPLATTNSGCLSGSKQYFNLGDMRLINNRSGSDARGCVGTMQKVCIDTDRSLSWTFNRPTCGGSRADPDYPEVEFGVAPFGTGSSSLVTPAYSSTTLLPIQISALTTASVTVDTFSTTFQIPNYWDSNFEFWISQDDPTKNADARVYAEIVVFLGWEANRQNSAQGGWSCASSGTVPNTNFNLCHQSDTWSSGYRFFNFVVSNGPLSSFNGKVDIKAILAWVMQNYSTSSNSALPSFSQSMWLTGIDLGTEIDDNTTGSAQVNNLTFEINGASRSVQLGP
jgi:hypothetical protein